MFRFKIFSLLPFLFLGLFLSGEEVVHLADKELLEILKIQEELFKQMTSGGGQKISQEFAETRAQQIVASYRNYLMRHPKSLEALILYGKFLRKIDQREEAMRVFLEARKRDPDVAVIQQELGNCFAEEGEYKGALNCFLNAVQLEPDEPVYHFQLGVLLTVYKEEFAEMEEYTGELLEKQADEAFDQAHRLSPRNKDILLAWGEALEQAGKPQWERSLEIWKQLMALSENLNQRQIVGMRMARTLIELQKYDEAQVQLAQIRLEALQENRRTLERRIANERKSGK